MYALLINIFQKLEETKIFDIKLMDAEDFGGLVLRFLFNFFITFILVRYIYYPVSKDRNYLFTFIIFNAIVFFVCYLLGGAKIEMGFAFGIFALFSILRYRTTTLPVKEMTYLFTVIAIAVINALSTKKVSYFELVFTNFAILGIIFIMDKMIFKFRGGFTTVVYEKIENIQPERREELMADLRDRTGLDIESIEVSRVNFMNDTARIKISYAPSENNIMSLKDDANS